MERALIQVDRVHRRFGQQVLFEGLSWRIPPDARVGLVGPNGAGKTTLLRIVAGLDVPDGGSVHRGGGPVGYLPQEVEAGGDGAVLDRVVQGVPKVAELEARLAELERTMAERDRDDPELERVTARYGELRHRFEDLGGDEVEARARAILTGLGIAEPRWKRPVSELSGGWRMRVMLARLLMTPGGVLLLDEPTNHLDLEALGWLEEFLEEYEGAYVVVSHDRYFLNRRTRTIAELDRGALVEYAGNYDDYLEEKAVRDAARRKAARLQAREVARVERFIERFRYKASKARQVQARVKALDKLERVEEPARRAKRLRFGFPPAPRSGDRVIEARGVDKAYGETVVYEGLDLLLRRGDRVALVGPNGAGKSTLLKLLSGIELPSSGVVEPGHNVHVRYYAQHQLEALDPSLTVLETLETVAGSAERQRLRTVAGSFLFSGDSVDKRVAVLSGGEKARLALCRLLLFPANLLLLDEPTNHLDLAGREVLEDALNEYEGTLVFVSHDRYFINRVATSVADVDRSGVEIHPGDYDRFLEATRARSEQAAASDGDDRRRQKRLDRRESRRAEAEERNRRSRERRDMEEEVSRVEHEIGALEQRRRELDESQADPATYRDADRAARIGRERAELDRRLGELYAHWEELASGLSDPG